jgi:hypothetical protein
MMTPADRLRTFLEPQIVATASRVALVVGTLLNLINQGPELLAHVGISWHKIAMNYLVPYCVATYSASAYQWGMHKTRKEG